MTSEEKKKLAIYGGSLVAFILGFRRVAGGIALYNAYRSYEQGHKTLAGVSAAVGGSLLIDPYWPEDVRAMVFSGGTSSYAPGESPADIQKKLDAIAARASKPALVAAVGMPKSPSDELLMGNWTMFDVAETQSPAVAAAANALKPGQSVALVLGQPGAPPKVFKAKVIPGGSAGRYAGQWTTGAPVSGPQMADFGPNHVMVVDSIT